MSLNGTDAVAVATIVGAAALTFIGTNALFGSHEGQAETCSANSSEIAFTRDGHRIEIHTGSGSASPAVIIHGERSARDEMRKRRRRHHHRHPHRTAERRFEFDFENCVEARIEAEMEQVEAQIEGQVRAQMQAAEMEAAQARVQAELAEMESKMERLQFRVRVEEAN